jgi:hypothetical protein
MESGLTAGQAAFVDWPVFHEDEEREGSELSKIR